MTTEFILLPIKKHPHVDKICNFSPRFIGYFIRFLFSCVGLVEETHVSLEYPEINDRSHSDIKTYWALMSRAPSVSVINVSVIND